MGPWGSLNGSLGLGQAQTGDLTDSLNDLDLLGADLGQHHVELGLLQQRSGSTSHGGGSSHSGGGDAELLLQSVDELGELQNSQTLNSSMRALIFSEAVIGNLLNKCL